MPIEFANGNKRAGRLCLFAIFLYEDWWHYLVADRELMMVVSPISQMKLSRHFYLSPTIHTANTLLHTTIFMHSHSQQECVVFYVYLHRYTPQISDLCHRPSCHKFVAATTTTADVTFYCKCENVSSQILLIGRSTKSF